MASSLDHFSLISFNILCMESSSVALGTSKTRKRPKLESAIQREICDWLHENRYFFWRSNNVPVFAQSGRNNNGKFAFRSLPKYTPKGLPDIIVVINGQIVCLEVKREGEKLKPHQTEFGINVVNAGGYYSVARSVEEAEAIVSKIKAKYSYA